MHTDPVKSGSPYLHYGQADTHPHEGWHVSAITEKQGKVLAAQDLHGTPSVVDDREIVSRIREIQRQIGDLHEELGDLLSRLQPTLPARPKLQAGEDWAGRKTPADWLPWAHTCKKTITPAQKRALTILADGRGKPHAGSLRRLRDLGCVAVVGDVVANGRCELTARGIALCMVLGFDPADFRREVAE